MTKKLTMLALILSIFSATQATAAVYSFNYSVGTGSASGSITTDGTLGTLTAANIVDWSVSLDGNPGNTFTLLGPLSGNNSAKLVSGSGLSATATDLMFDFSQSGYLLLQNPSIGSGQNFICFAGHDVCGGFSNAINVTTSVFGVNTLTMSGLQSIATTVPEPDAFAMLGLGLALMGLIGRRKVV